MSFFPSISKPFSYEIDEKPDNLPNAIWQVQKTLFTLQRILPVDGIIPAAIHPIVSFGEMLVSLVVSDEALKAALLEEGTSFFVISLTNIVTVGLLVPAMGCYRACSTSSEAYVSSCDSQSDSDA